jgi:hypothetical protein
MAGPPSALHDIARNKINQREYIWRAARSVARSVSPATASSASAGHAWSQSIVQQLTSAGFTRTRSRNAPPTGDMQSATCRLARQRATKHAQSCVGVSRPRFAASGRTISRICAGTVASCMVHVSMRCDDSAPVYEAC